jgi:hypothetical protein
VRRSAALILVGVAVAAMLALGRPPVAGAAADRLPDLGMARLRDLSIDTTTRLGRRLLRFTTIIVNIGAGPFETIGRRPDTTTAQMAVAQRIYNSAGSYREVRTPTVMFWAGDGHDHWHVRDVEAYRLLRLDNGRRVGTGAKHGFCYFDNTAYRLGLAGAPTSPVYGGCGARGDLRVKTGVSVGWGGHLPGRDRISVDRRHRAEVGPLSAARHRRSGQLVRRDEQRQQQHLGRPQADWLRRSGGGLRAGCLTSPSRGHAWTRQVDAAQTAKWAGRR